ncbi:hypothetical protein RDABS01_016495 [Bienertia sinuspersici]
MINQTSVEIVAARYGIGLARRLGFDKIIIECDALNVYHAIKAIFSSLNLNAVAFHPSTQSTKTF